MSKIELVRVFVSSPGNMEEERRLVSKVCDQINQDIGQIRSFRVEAVLWETHSASGIGNRSQAVINDQTDKYDIYLGIMGAYFGSTTGKFDSGTQEEFEIALKRHQEGDITSVQFYFSDSLPTLSQINPKQLEKVQEFKRQVGESGVLYKHFSDLTQLELHCRKGLFWAIESVLTGSSTDSKTPITQAEITDRKPYEILANLNRAFSSDPLVSSHILTVEATKSVSDFSDRLIEMNGRLKKITNALNLSVRELTSYNSGQKKNLKKVVKSVERVMVLMEDFTYFYSHEVSSLDRTFSAAMSSLQRAAQIVIASEELESEGMLSAIEAAKSMTSGLEELRSAVLLSSKEIADNLVEGDRLVGSARAFRAISLDFAEFLGRAIESVGQIASEYADS